LKNQKHNLPTTQFEVPPLSEKTLSGFQQAGKKEGGLREEFLSARLFWVVVGVRRRRQCISQSEFC